MKKLSISYQLMILITVVLATYYPTNFAEICLVDDYGAMSSFFSQETFSLQEIFFPKSAGGGYYRPLIAVSYLIDKQLWFLHERLMHFEGVVAHLVNALLVFALCWEAVRLYLKEQDSWLPLGAAFLFALHPIATESVNWISGRTDVMMSTFVLVSVLCLLRFTQTRLKTYFVLAVVSAGFACLAKEAAFGYLLAMPLLALYAPEQSCQPNDEPIFPQIQLMLYYTCAAFAALLTGSYWLVLGCGLLYLMHRVVKRLGTTQIRSAAGTYVKWFCSFMFVAAGVAGLFLALRKLAFTSSVSKIGQTVTLMLADLNYTISLFLGAVGFYVKKFFIPLPLNFFILEIDPLYDFLGIAVLLMVCHLVVQARRLPVIMVFLGLLLLLPALPFAFGTIAWTAYAERYIYLSSAFWSVAFFLWLGRLLAKHPELQRMAALFVFGICLVAAVITFKRNTVWQSNVSLMRDTVRQTPNVRKLRNIYIKALVDKGLLDEALNEYYRAAGELPSAVHDEQAALIIGRKLSEKNFFCKSLQIYHDGLQRNDCNSEALLTASIHLLQQMQVKDTVSDHCKIKSLELLRSYTNLLNGMKNEENSNYSYKMVCHEISF